MTTKLSDRDWELLSTYLDGFLSPENHRQVEARLSRDAEFRAVYVSLVRTRGILHSVTDVKRRKNFYLTPDMIRPRGWTWLIPTLNLSSAATGILAFIFLMMDILPLARMASPMRPALEAAPLIQSTEEATWMDYAAENTPVQELRAAIESDKELPTEIKVEPAGQAEIQATESVLKDQMPALDTASGGGDVQNQVMIPEPPSEAPAAAPAPLMEGAAPSGAGELEDTQPITAAPTSSPQPTMAAQMKAAPTRMPESTVETAIPNMVEATGVQSSSPEAVIEQAATIEESAPETLGSVADSPAPAVDQPSLPRPSITQSFQAQDSMVKPESESKPWPASRMGGIFLLLSIGLAATGYLLKKRADL
jgi:anti-sigma factor RsiW